MLQQSNTSEYVKISSTNETQEEYDLALDKEIDMLLEGEEETFFETTETNDDRILTESINNAIEENGEVGAVGSHYQASSLQVENGGVPVGTQPTDANLPEPYISYSNNNFAISDEMRITFNEHDGVFSNMAVKPSDMTTGKIYEELEPPSYHETVVDPAPDYFLNCVDETGEVLIEGLPMGNFALFSITVFISMTFDILGFFLTTMLATSHAARLGSQAGLGLTLMRYGALLRERAGLNLDNRFGNDMEYRDPEEEKSRRLWSASFILIFGVFVCIRAIVEFIRLRRMKAMISSTPLNYGL